MLKQRRLLMGVLIMAILLIPTSICDAKRVFTGTTWDSLITKESMGSPLIKPIPKGTAVSGTISSDEISKKYLMWAKEKPQYVSYAQLIRVKLCIVREDIGDRRWVEYPMIVVVMDGAVSHEDDGPGHDFRPEIVRRVDLLDANTGQVKWSWSQQYRFHIYLDKLAPYFRDYPAYFRTSTK